MRSIIRNSMMTPDGTHLISRDTHDYVTYEDENGEEYMVDGGLSYIRRSSNKHPAKDTTLYTDDDHELLREEITWGSWRGEGELVYIPIKKLREGHINNIIKDGYVGKIVDLMKRELIWRKEHGESISD